MRDEGMGVFDSVREAIQIGERAGVPVDILHLKIADETPLSSDSCNGTRYLQDESSSKLKNGNRHEYIWIMPVFGLRVLARRTSPSLEKDKVSTGGHSLHSLW
jgi:hypothetical protein